MEISCQYQTRLCGRLNLGGACDARLPSVSQNLGMRDIYDRSDHFCRASFTASPCVPVYCRVVTAVT